MSLASWLRELLEAPAGRRAAEVRAEVAEGRVAALEAELAEVRRGLERRTADGRRLAESQRDLVANVSHELKTPLTAIRGVAETLKDGALDDRAAARRFVGRILEQCERLEALVRDLLTLSRFESVGPGEEELDLLPILRDAASTLAPRAEARGVTVELQARAEPKVRGDRLALEQLFLNLVDNAVKYNRDGGTVRIRLGALGGRASVEVEDTGIGIPPGDLERIFERFYRVDKGRARDEGGTGLGLAIVERVVRVHGGEIEVQSDLGRGTRFRVWLPLAARD